MLGGAALLQDTCPYHTGTHTGTAPLEDEGREWGGAAEVEGTRPSAHQPMELGANAGPVLPHGLDGTKPPARDRRLLASRTAGRRALPGSRCLVTEEAEEASPPPASSFPLGQEPRREASHPRHRQPCGRESWASACPRPFARECGGEQIPLKGAWTKPFGKPNLPQIAAAGRPRLGPWETVVSGRDTKPPLTQAPSAFRGHSHPRSRPHPPREGTGAALPCFRAGAGAPLRLLIPLHRSLTLFLLPPGPPPSTRLSHKGSG